MKTIALVVLLTLISNFAFAESGILFNTETAQKIDGDIKFHREDAKTAKEKLDLATKDRALADKEIEQLKLKSTSLKEDLEIVIKAKDDYKNLYVKTDEARLKCEDEKPSRMTWFGTGFVAAAITGLIVIFAAK